MYSIMSVQRQLFLSSTTTIIEVSSCHPPSPEGEGALACEEGRDHRGYGEETAKRLSTMSILENPHGEAHRGVPMF